MKFTFYGQSCFSIVLNNGIKLLFDPFISGNPKASEIRIENIEADYIFVSHGHADHTLDLVALAKQTNAIVICAWEIYEWLGKQGVTNSHPMNTGGSWNFDELEVKCVVAQHSSSLPDGTYAGNPMGFLITHQNKTLYYSGDTALTLDMQLIPLWKNVDIAILPIGDNFTMGTDDAIRCAQFTKANKVIGVHFDTFGFIEIDHEATKQKFENAKISFLLPTIAVTYGLDN